MTSRRSRPWREDAAHLTGWPDRQTVGRSTTRVRSTLGDETDLETTGLLFRFPPRLSPPSTSSTAVAPSLTQTHPPYIAPLRAVILAAILFLSGTNSSRGRIEHSMATISGSSSAGRASDGAAGKYQLPRTCVVHCWAVRLLVSVAVAGIHEKCLCASVGKVQCKAQIHAIGTRQTGNSSTRRR